MDGHDEVRIFGEEHKVRCQVKCMDAFSGHADRSELLDYVALNPPSRLKQVFLVHGEAEQAESLRDGLVEQGVGQVTIPQRGDVVEI